MLQAFKNWPNTTVAVICVLVLSGAFLLSIVNSPGAHRMPYQLSEPVDRATVGSVPQHLLEDRYIDYSVIYPQNGQ
jgi:hypothetical protein